MLIRALSAQYLANITAGLLSVAFALWVARQIGPGAFADYSFYFAFGSIAAIFMDGGYRTMLLRESAQPSSALTQHTSRLPAMASGHLAIASLTITLGLIGFAPSSAQLGFIAATFYFLALDLGQFISGILKGHGQFLSEARWLLLHRLTGVVVPGVALLLAPSVSPVWLLALGGAGMLLPALRWRKLPMLAGLFRPVPGGLVVMTAALPFLVSDLAMMLNLRMDLFMLKAAHVNGIEIGNYAAASRFYECVLNLSGVPIAYFVFRIRKTEQNAALATMAMPLLLASAAALVAALMLRIIAPAGLVLILGPAYQDTALFLRVLLWTGCFQLPLYVLWAWCLARNRERLYAAAVVSGTLLDAGLSWWWVHLGGGIGAAWASVATQAFILLALLAGLYGRPDGLTSESSDKASSGAT